MRGDKETGAIIATQIIEEEGPSRDGGESGQGEFGSGESGGDGDCGEHGEPVLEVCEAQDGVHRAQRRGMV